MATSYRQWLRISSVALACAMLLQTANAEVATDAGNTLDVTGNDNALQEITVTAQRRSESKQTTPVAITAFTSESLNDNLIEDAADLQKLTPGVILNGGGNQDNPTYTIRGQGKATAGAGLPSVVTYVNEVPLPSYGSPPPPFDLSNIQILKGPQGTAFGRNTTGGAVLYYTAQPTFDSINGYVQVQGGNYRDNEYQGALNLPVIPDVLAIRIGADLERRQGFTEDLSTGRNLDDKHLESFRFSALLKPGAGITNSFEFDYSKYRENGTGIFAFQIIDPVYIAPFAAQGNPSDRTLSTSIAPFQFNTFWGVSNTTSADLNVLTIKNIFGYRNTSIHQTFDNSGSDITPLPAAVLASIGAPPASGIDSDSEFTVNTEQYSDELQFSGKLFSDTLTWLLGGFYLDSRPDGVNYIALANYVPVPVSPIDTAIANSPFFKGAWPFSSLQDSLASDESRSLFGTLTYDLSKLTPVLNGLRLNAGYRYTWDNEGICGTGRGVVSLADASAFKLLEPPYGTTEQCRADPNAYSSSATFQAPTRTLGVDYTVNDDLFLYFTNRTGYRAGGLNTPALSPSLEPFQTFAPQKVTDYEVGLHAKWQAGDWRGRFNIDFYHDKYKDLQLEATGIFAGSIPDVTAANAPADSLLTINAGSATFEGMELDGLISPFSGLNLTYGASYLNARYDSLVVPTVLQPFFTAQHFTGSPRWSYQAQLEYVLPLHLPPSVGGKVSVLADYYHISSEYQGFAQLPAYELSDFSVLWKNMANKNLDLTLFVQNAFNTQYVLNTDVNNTSFGLYSGSYGPPRMYGARLRYSFGK